MKRQLGIVESDQLTKHTQILGHHVTVVLQEEVVHVLLYEGFERGVGERLVSGVENEEGCSKTV